MDSRPRTFQTSSTAGCHVDTSLRVLRHTLYIGSALTTARMYGVNTRTQRRSRAEEAPLLLGGCFLFTPFPPLFTRGFSRHPRSSRLPTDGLPPFFLLRNRAPPRARHTGPSQTVPSPPPALASLSRGSANRIRRTIEVAGEILTEVRFNGSFRLPSTRSPLARKISRR